MGELLHTEERWGRCEKCQAWTPHHQEFRTDCLIDKCRVCKLVQKFEGKCIKPPKEQPGTSRNS